MSEYNSLFKKYFDDKKKELDQIYDELKEIKSMLLIEDSFGYTIYYSILCLKEIEKLFEESDLEELDFDKFKIIYTTNAINHDYRNEILNYCDKKLLKIYLNYSMNGKLVIKYY
jgi:hypothetical protein